MITPARRRSNPPKIQRLSMRDWESGTVTAYDDRRTPIKGLRISENGILEQDAVFRPRPSLAKYGPQPIGTRLGELFNFKVTTPTGSVSWLACLQNVAGTTNLYVAKPEDTTWTLAPGKTYHQTARGHFSQLAGKLAITNGQDNLSLLDTSTMTVTPFTAISNPTAAPTLDNNQGLTGTAFKVFYAITANSTVGETKGSPVMQQAILLDRDMWNPDTNSIRIKWTAVTNAKSYNVYVGIGVDGGGQPTLYQVASGLPPDQLVFTDNGSRALDESKPLPEDNSTAGPRAERSDVVNGRMWLVGDRDNPFRVWRGGDYKHEFDFSPASGGGWSVVGSGTKDVPISVKPYRKYSGEPKVMVLSKGMNGKGRRFFISPSQVSYGSESITIWEVEEDTGEDGTDSPDGVVIYNNDVLYPSRDGFKTTGTLPQLQTALSTRRITNTIQTDIPSLNTSAMQGCVGVAYEGRVYWAVPVNSDRNNQIWVYDTDRKGAWMKPWSIAADWLMLCNDNSGRTHFIACTDSGIYEFNRSFKTSDEGKGFNTGATSGQLRFSEDGRDWARVLKVIYVLMRPQGRINFTVSGRTEEDVQAFNEVRTFGANASRTGWSEPGVAWGTAPLRWSGVRSMPEDFNSASEEIEIEIDEDMQWIQYGWNTTGVGVDYAVSDVVIEYINVGPKDLN